jgi:hypothetical protein
MTYLINYPVCHIPVYHHYYLMMTHTSLKVTEFICASINGISLTASDLQDRVPYRQAPSDSESSSICWGAPDHQCHTLDHEAYLCRVQ